MSFNSTLADFPVNDGNSSNTSLSSEECTWTTLDIYILTAFFITNILLLVPLSALVLFLGCKRWKQQRSSSNLAAKTSHTDIFTYHMTTMEIILVLASVFFCVGVYAELPGMRRNGYEIFSCTWCVKMNFHSLTCVERHLAVVHPITYLHLKNGVGDRIRNFSIGFVWFSWLVTVCVVLAANVKYNVILYLCFVAFTLVVVLFCSISVLWVLKRPGPGDVGGDRKKVDQMKLRAFHTIGFITVALLLSFGGMLACDAVEASGLLSRDVGCSVMTSAVWFSLSSSLVLPLLFLHGAGVLPCCKYKTSD